jgi:TRAP-type C4-dicarboxylate transport system permease large subunit
MIPFWIAMVVSVALITYIPALSNWLPSLLGK